MKNRDCVGPTAVSAFLKSVKTREAKKRNERERSREQ